MIEDEYISLSSFVLKVNYNVLLLNFMSKLLKTQQFTEALAFMSSSDKLQNIVF